METRKKSLIYWVPTELGGKITFPTLKYSTAAHFLNDEPDNDWSVILEIIEKVEEYIYSCFISFLVPDKAPIHLLESGNKFELFESKKVADGEVL